MRKLLQTLALVFIAVTASFSQSTVLTGGNNFSVGLCNNKKVFAWGSNASGQIGQGTTTESATYESPTPVIFPGAATSLNFIQVNAGSGAHGLALDCNGHVWVWGENECGQVGNGTSGSYAGCTAANASTPSPTPSEVLLGAQTAGTGANATYLHSIKFISGGNDFSMAIDSSGNLWTWGNNEYGELGNGTSGNLASTPTQVKKCSGGNLTNIVQVQGGDYTTYALDATGQVWAWGSNANNALGDGATTNSDCAIEVMKGPATAAGPPATGLTPLNGIKDLAAGDTHGMALDSSGQVWTWGGDWAPGQLGQGSQYVSNTFASRVVAPGDYTAATNNLGVCAGCTFLTNASYIAAGQASSVIVLSTGDVVSMGGFGLYNGCATGELLFSGTLGAGIVSTAGTCQSNATRCTSYTNGTTYGPAGCAGFGTPIPVQTSAGIDLKNIVSVARGDGWYFATDGSGNTYTWGFNGASGTQTATGNYGGELGIGSNVDQAYAVAVTLPTACGGVAKPCPSKPALGSNFSVCPSSSFTLTAGETETGYTYKWYSSTTGTGVVGSGSWTQLPYTPYALGVGDSVYTGTMGTTAVWYGVVVSYTNGCGNICKGSDSVKVSPILPSWSANGSYCATNPNVQFNVTGAGTDGFKWYTVATGGTAVGSSNETTPLTIAETSTNTTVPGCSYALYVEDTSTFQASLMPVGTGPATTCANGNWVVDNAAPGANGTMTLIYVSAGQSLTLNSLQFYQRNDYGAGPGNFSFVVYSDNPTGGPYCGGCTPAGNYHGPNLLLHTSAPAASLSAGSQNVLQTITDGSPYTLTGAAGTGTYYWVGLQASSTGWATFKCAQALAAGSDTWTTTYWDNSGYNIVKAMGGIYQGGVQYGGAVLNLTFTAGTPYACSRLLVCAVSGTCPAPVKFLAFTAEQQSSSVFLNWSTGSEQNSSYFEVQRSTDGINFTNIGKVAAAGYSSIIKNYSFTDNGASELTGTVYYRITEYDNNGETTVSSIETISTGKGNDVKVIPNPNNGSFTVVVVGEQEVLGLLIYNSVGQVIYSSSGKAEGSSFTQNINLQNVPAGVYFLSVQTPSNTWVKKVVKE